MPIFPPSLIVAGWKPMGSSQIARWHGPNVTALVFETAIGWLAETRDPTCTLRRPYPTALEAIAALKAAEAASPACREWLCNPLESGHWVLDVMANGRSRWGALAYGHYALVVAELPRRDEDQRQFVAFVSGEAVKVTVFDWEYDHPGEPAPEDPSPFTVFDDPAKARHEAEDVAYGWWLAEPGSPQAASDCPPGPLELTDIASDPRAIAAVFATVE